MENVATSGYSLAVEGVVEVEPDGAVRLERGVRDTPLRLLRDVCCSTSRVRDTVPIRNRVCTKDDVPEAADNWRYFRDSDGENGVVELVCLLYPRSPHCLALRLQWIPQLSWGPPGGIVHGPVKPHDEPVRQPVAVRIYQ